MDALTDEKAEDVPTGFPQAIEYVVPEGFVLAGLFIIATKLLAAEHIAYVPPLYVTSTEGEATVGGSTVKLDELGITEIICISDAVPHSPIT